MAERMKCDESDEIFVMEAKRTTSETKSIRIEIHDFTKKMKDEKFKKEPIVTPTLLARSWQLKSSRKRKIQMASQFTWWTRVKKKLPRPALLMGCWSRGPFRRNKLLQTRGGVSLAFWLTRISRSGLRDMTIWSLTSALFFISLRTSVAGASKGILKSFSATWNIY